MVDGDLKFINILYFVIFNLERNKSQKSRIFEGVGGIFNFFSSDFFVL